MIKYTGWTVFDPIASLFIAALIMASVIPLVIDSGRVLCLDVGAEVERDIRTALTEVSLCQQYFLICGCHPCLELIRPAQLANVEGLANYSAPRIWPRNEGEYVGSIHIQLALSESAYGRDPISGELKPHTHGRAIYANADKVVSRVKKVLKSRIAGLAELVVQTEGSEERAFCDCMTGN